MRDSLSFSGDDYEIIAAEDGRSGLELLEAARPDVVLLEIAMPGVGGLSACSELKRNPSTAQARIVIVSARTESDFIAASLKAGAADYLTKPFQPAELARRVRRALQREERASKRNR